MRHLKKIKKISGGLEEERILDTSKIITRRIIIIIFKDVILHSHLLTLLSTTMTQYILLTRCHTPTQT